MFLELTDHRFQSGNTKIDWFDRVYKKQRKMEKLRMKTNKVKHIQFFVAVHRPVTCLVNGCLDMFSFNFSSLVFFCCCCCWLFCARVCTCIHTNAFTGYILAQTAFTHGPKLNRIAWHFQSALTYIGIDICHQSVVIIVANLFLSFLSVWFCIACAWYLSILLFDLNTQYTRNESRKTELFWLLVWPHSHAVQRKETNQKVKMTESFCHRWHAQSFFGCWAI